ncbi:RNA-binding S4 domain-containing protein [Roseinatronobacter alkalisoli]|uniref:RNA-binding S4 domain-containing protein n=1 Tax=Roseinatronobacter alkalisoli TaxID=3028235 RepID=A0ABT5T5K5_9RHOB|nr:RNA-binding S4 domain-containing protein [Roseinatronobacter sp. HJB301]MDD7969512.1 RNA-binding S4 domain-containing protein [Roseinatronobacter sp. HJB301]
MSRETIRLDKWLWHARFVKTRSLAVKLVSGPGFRVNSVPVSKPAVKVGADDVLSFSLGARVVVVRVLDCGTRRGPAPEAQSLYEDLSPPPPPKDLSRPVPVAGGRPDKRDRRRFAASAPDRLD